MSTKVWNNLTTHLQGILTDRLNENDVSSVMESWAEQKSAVSKLVGDSSATTSRKRKKDPNAPKKPSSSYIFYCSDVREHLKKENPDLKATELTKKMGETWKSLDAKKKKKYEQKAEEDKLRYAEAMKSYTPPEGTGDEEKKKSRRSKKERTGPKKGLSSYMFYCKDVRPQLKEDYPEMKATDITKKMGEMWRDLSEDEKSLFVDLAEKDKERYEQECASSGIETKSSKSKASKPAKVEKVEKVEKPKETKTVKPSKTEKPKTEKTEKTEKPKTEKQTKKVDSDAELSSDDSSSEEVSKKKEKETTKPSKKQRLTGYILFCQEMRPKLKEENPKWKAPQVTKELSKRWKELNDGARDAFNDRALADGEQVAK